MAKPHEQPAGSRVVNLQDKLARFSDLFAPKVVAEMNDYQFKLVKVKGEFTWHDHPDTDEAFLVLQGRLTIEFRDEAVRLEAGELYVVARGREHKPSASEECQVLLVEPRGTVNTGDVRSELTAASDAWV